jgi:chromosome segregation ATPase
LLRQVSTKLKEDGLEPAQLGFAIRLKKIMEENDIREDQLESLILDINSYCLKHKVTLDKVFESGYEALNLEFKFGISVEKIPEFIIQGKKTIEELERQRQELIGKKQEIKEKYHTILALLEKYGKEKPLIEHIKALERKLDEFKKSKESYEARCRKLEGEVSTLDTQRGQYLHEWSLCQEERERDERKKSRQ